MVIFTYAILYHRMFDVRSFALQVFVRGALFVAVLGIGYAAYRLMLRGGGEPSSFWMLALFLGLLAFGRSRSRSSRTRCCRRGWSRRRSS